MIEYLNFSNTKIPSSSGRYHIDCNEKTGTTLLEVLSVNRWC